MPAATRPSGIRNGLLKTIPQDFPRVRAVMWFDRSMEQDWRVDSSQASLEAFRSVVSSSVYGGSDPAPTAAEPPSPEMKALRVTPSGAMAHVARPRAALRAKVVYRLSHRARVRIALRGGRRGSAKTVTMEHPTRGGRIRLSNLIRGRRVHRGSYRVVARAIDSRGARSKPKQVRFRVASPDA